MEKDGFNASFDYSVAQFSSKFGLAFDNYLVTFDRNYFAGILIHEVFSPRFEDVSGQGTSLEIMNSLLVDFNFLSESKAIEDVFIRLESDSAEQGSNREFFLTVDISIHDFVNVGSEFNPRAAERDDTSGIEFRTVRVH